ncbi:DUF3800 domain-containing protein [Bradyrhizobium sp. 6(2017)]|uniref:DUF3800 domain-containing protein n=1 Tax=Bradyrhizobium sp. 6(2017) TaxID=1197460 RepID=UPI0013E0F289|nr:DUF3800 domain-containing protein [Bradyrhizobium sp. 6(2017)]QIG92149.1 DUF3800 domain-containing protein [Bradyrhizobium sp. 6(2017)]
MLRAYFDETGIHANSPVTFIAGFIGTADQWAAVEGQWLAEMGPDVFHYKFMRSQTERIERLAHIVASSGLLALGAGFSGNWERAISHRDWRNRVSDPYHLCFEICTEHMERLSDIEWQSQQVEVTFSDQQDYAKRAQYIWRAHKASGFWKKIASLAYGDPKTTWQLQVADMIAYEVFQCMKTGDEGSAWEHWPLCRALLDHGGDFLGVYHTEKTFIEMMENVDKKGRAPLKAERPTRREK